MSESAFDGRQLQATMPSPLTEQLLALSSLLRKLS